MKYSRSYKIFLGFLLILVFLPTFASSEETYKFERMWPTLQQPWYFNWPTGIAVDNEDNFYVVDAGNFRIKKFNSDGQFVTSWGSDAGGDCSPGGLAMPRGIAVDSNNFVYVADAGCIGIHKFTSDGQFVASFANNEEFDSLYGIAIDSSDILYITASKNHCVKKFTPDGEFISSWGTYGKADGKFDRPAGIAVDSNGNVYVVDGNNSRIQKFTSDGQFIASWGSSGSGDGEFDFITPELGELFGWIAIDAKGYVYVADSCNDRVQKFTSDGNFVTKWGNDGHSWYNSNVDGQLSWPNGISVGSNGLIYVVDRGNERIQKFTSDGQFVTKWGKRGSGNGQFEQPRGITIDDEGNIYVTDYWGHHIQKFTSDGQFITKWGSYNDLTMPRSIAADNAGYLYVATASCHLTKFTSDGQFVSTLGSCGTADGEFDRPAGVAVDTSGNVYVMDSNNSRIQKFTSDGQFITKWGGYGSGDGEFNFELPHPAEVFDWWGGGDGIVVSDYVYVTDTGNCRIQKFTLDGQFVTKWGSCGTGEGEFEQPNGIAIDANGDIYVSDWGGHHIQKFTSDGQFIKKFGEFGTEPGRLNSPSNMCISTTGDVYVADSYNSRIQVFRKVDLAVNTKTIILAGGGSYPGNNLWDITQMNANFAYRALTYQGYSKGDIYYLSSDTDLDLDNNGVADDVDADSTIANLQQTISTWASDADNLILYLTGNGDSGTFRMNDTEFLSVNDLDSWLDALEESISGKITVIYDAFSSGSFLLYLTPTANKDRIVITSTSPGEIANFVSQGSVSFSSFFWTHIFNGNNVYDAFNKAKSSLVEALGTQHPLLDDTGNGIGNEDLDGTLAQSTFIGNGTEITGDAPVIGAISPAQSLTDNPSALLYAEGVTDANGIARVWAVIQPPYYTLDLPIIDLMLVGNDLYEATYDGFDTHGTYKIAIYARDSIGNTSVPSKTTVTVNNPATMQANSTLKIYIVEGEKDTYAIDDLLTLKANYRTGAGEDLDLTETVNWTSTDASVGELSAGAQVMTLTFKANGKVGIIASINGKIANLDFVVGQPAATKHHGNLIIVAGGKPDDPKDTLKDAVQYMSDQMYKVFKARKFDDEDIYYINHNNNQDFDGDGVSDGIVDQTTKTVETLKNAINWAQSQPNDGSLYLYLIDHGEKNGTFLIDTGQILTAAELDASLDVFEAATGRISIIMLDACYSGSFLEALQDTDRIVFTSSAADEYSYFSSGGDICFGQFFSNYLLVGKNWEEAFDLAVLDMDEVGEPYASMTPQKSIGTEVTVAQVYGDFAIAGLFPDIKTWTKGNDVNADTPKAFSVELDIMDTEGVSVWALVMPPYYQPPTTDEEFSTPILGLEKVNFSTESGTKTFSGEYTFTYNGTYNVTYYVKDSNGIVISSPPEAFVVTGGKDPGDTITLSTSWNLLSLPVVPTDATVEEVLSGVKDNIASVWKWENGKWAVYLPSFTLGDYLDYVNSKGFGFLTHIYCGEGFWINSETVQTLTVTGGPPADTSCALTSGWNLIGLKSNQAKSITELISSNTDKIVSVWKWLEGNWAVYLPGQDTASYATGKGFTELSGINPGEGFWVNCTEAITLP